MPPPICPRRARAHSFKEGPFHGAKATFASPTAHTVLIASLVFRATMRIQTPLLRRSSGRAAPNRNFFAGILAILVSSGCGGVTTGTSEEGSGKPPEEGAPSRPTGCTGVHSGTLTIGTRGELEAAAGIGEVQGDLIIQAEERYEIRAEDLPCLSRVRGSVTIGSLPSLLLTGVTLGALETLDGGLTVGLVDLFREGEPAASFPRLRRVGTYASGTDTGLQIIEARLLPGVGFPVLEEVRGSFEVRYLDVREIEFPALRAITGSLMLGPAEDLARADLGRLEHIGGDVTVLGLPHLARSFMESLAATAGGTATIAHVGCARADQDATPDCEGP